MAERAQGEPMTGPVREHLTAEQTADTPPAAGNPPGQPPADPAPEPPPAAFARAHLRIRLAGVHRALRVAVSRRAALTARLTRPDLTPYCVTDDQVGVLLDEVGTLTATPAEPAGPGEPEPAVERELRRRAAAGGITLPLDALARRFGLTRADQDALLLVAAPELDRAHERIYAYLMDDLTRRLPTVELLATVGAGAAPDRPARLRALGPAGPLRRYGLLRPYGEFPAGSERELSLGPGVFTYLLGWGGDPGLLGHDPGEVPPPDPGTASPYLSSEPLTRLGRALGSGAIDLAGLWGCAAGAASDAVHALARAAGRSPRIATGDPEADLRMAAELGALLWIPTDDLHGDSHHALADSVRAVLLRSRTPVCLTGPGPWRPAAPLAARRYAELTVPVPALPDRRAMWSAALPELSGALLDDLAVRYRMNGGEIRAVASVARTGARLAGDGRPLPVGDHIAPAIATVTRGRAGAGVHSVVSRHTADDLVLPDAQLRQIREIAAAFRAWPRIAEEWGFARRAAHGGVKALFTGEPGTGKTMSAAIVSGMLGLELLKVDLAAIVSKWVGETEKNMEAAFRQAEESHAVLLFDEADALFGKRGEVKQGTDRYANLEVGYLLQRLEASDGLVILTSNLKDNIDPAFTRRFHFVVHFPRPAAPERRRLWRLAFPPEAPLAPDFDFDALSRLDMTGAGIAAAARTAALAAADGGSRAIGMRHAVRGVTRQFQREARLLRPSELGRYAELLGDDDGPQD
ncbi:ATP-binding protein [Streptomyces sp. CAU 1734]|uniref:AAA family ATPase n=1 Tax=Streptomyces sp. CAU 1734 TaxID=3140360 RepID=UPI00326142D5